MFQLFRVVVEIPAIDRLLDYLEGKDQAAVDTATADLAALAARLHDHTTRLQSAIDKEK